MHTILADIEAAIIRRLRDKGLQATVFDICDAEDADNIICPAVNCSFWDGSFKKATLSGRRLTMPAKFYLTTIIQNAQSEQARRHTVYPIVFASVSLLSGWYPTNQDGARITGAGMVSPGRLRKTYESKTRIAFVLELTSTLTVECASEEEAAELLAVAMQYVFQPGECAAAEDFIDLN
jgi:hypothetical protein